MVSQVTIIVKVVPMSVLVPGTMLVGLKRLMGPMPAGDLGYICREISSEKFWKIPTAKQRGAVCGLLRRSVEYLPRRLLVS